MEYASTKSNYIKSLIKETSWQDHVKIDDLIKLHNYILNHPRSFVPGMHYTYLKQKYDNEFLILLREFSEQAYDTEIKTRIAFRERCIEDAKKAEELVENQKINWLKAGGQP